MSWGNILQAASENHVHNSRKGGVKNMGTLAQEAEQYEPKKTLNVADLASLSLDLPTEEREGTDREGKAYNFKVVVVDGKEYRVPGVVLGDIKACKEAKPNLKTVKVIKKGTGNETRYTVIPME